MSRYRFIVKPPKSAWMVCYSDGTDYKAALDFLKMATSTMGKCKVLPFIGPAYGPMEKNDE